MKKYIIDFFHIFSNEKSFDSTYIGNYYLNLIGLHIFRIFITDIFSFVRRLPFLFLSADITALNKNGYMAIEDFLTDNEFASLEKEIRSQLENSNVKIKNESQTTGFGSKIEFEFGFDRFDGNTRNRFISIDKNRTPYSWEFLKNKTLRNTMVKLSGIRFKTKKNYIYHMSHGDQTQNFDDQKLWHKDTFFHTYKFWFFINDATPERGPFWYIPGSHKLTWSRIKFEYKRSLMASKGKPSFGGAFRITEQEIKEMNCQEPKQLTVKKNTLVIADTRGVHRRGNAEIGSERFAIYGNIRPQAFLPFPY